MPRGKFYRFGAYHARNPHRRVGLLQRQYPRIHNPKMIVFTFPGERPWRCPGFDNQIVGLGEPFSVEHRVGIRGHTFLSDAAHKPADNPQTTRPPEIISIIAISSATRTGLSWIGSTFPRNTIFPCLVSLARTAPMTLTEGIKLRGLLWCSLIITPSKPDSEQC